MSILRFDELVELARSFQVSRTLLTAIELDIFSAVGRGATAPEVAARLNTDCRATEMLLNALVALGALRKREGTFRNTAATARYLAEGSPDNQRLALMHAVSLWDAWSELTDCVRLGRPRNLQGRRRSREQTEAFIAAMHSNAASRAPALVRAVGAAKVRRMLDVGGGSGAYSIAFAQANPALEAVVFDRAEVLPIAEQHIRAAGLGERIRIQQGDLRKDDLGEGYDLVLLSAICHMLSPQENQDLLRRSFRALEPGGRVVIRDFILSADKTRPQRGALFSLNMLVNTEGGASYSREEYQQWLRAAGFHAIRYIGMADPGSGLMLGTKPRG